MQLEIFKNSEFEVRVVVEDNEPSFCLNDVCRILEIKNPTDVKNAIDMEFDKGGRFNLYPLQTAGGMQNFIFINESEFYFVLMRSDKAQAKPFRKWVNTEVLPSIMKHGGYLTDAKIEEALLNPDTIIRLATDLKAERERRKVLEAERIANLPKIAFATAVEASATSALIGDFVKSICDEDVKVGRNRIFKWLRNKKYLMPNNMPYQKYVDSGYFEVIPQIIVTTSGNKEKFTTKITAKGQVALSVKIVEAFKAA